MTCSETLFKPSFPSAKGSLDNAIVVKATIDYINRATGLADITYVTTCETDPPTINLPTTDIPFYYYCEDSDGSLGEHLRGHEAFRMTDLVYVITYFESPGVNKTYIFGHVDIRGTKLCQTEFVEIIIGGYVSIVDISAGKLVNISEVSIDPEGPTPPISWPVDIRDLYVGPKYTAYLNWRGYYFEGVITDIAVPYIVSYLQAVSYADGADVSDNLIAHSGGPSGSEDCITNPTGTFLYNETGTWRQRFNLSNCYGSDASDCSEDDNWSEPPDSYWEKTFSSEWSVRCEGGEQSYRGTSTINSLFNLKTSLINIVDLTNSQNLNFGVKLEVTGHSTGNVFLGATSSGNGGYTHSTFQETYKLLVNVGLSSERLCDSISFSYGLDGEPNDASAPMGDLSVWGSYYDHIGDWSRAAYFAYHTIQKNRISAIGEFGFYLVTLYAGIMPYIADISDTISGTLGYPNPPGTPCTLYFSDTSLIVGSGAGPPEIGLNTANCIPNSDEFTTKFFRGAGGSGTFYRAVPNIDLENDLSIIQLVNNRDSLVSKALEDAAMDVLTAAYTAFGTINLESAVLDMNVYRLREI